MSEATAKPTKFNSAFIPLSLITLLAPFAFLSVQSFYKADRATEDIEALHKSLHTVSVDVSQLRSDWSRTDAKLEFISELLKEVRNNQKKGN